MINYKAMVLGVLAALLVIAISFCVGTNYGENRMMEVCSYSLKQCICPGG